MQSATPPGGREINYGIHALRILAMFFVCLLHSSAPGGVVGTVPNPNIICDFFSACELVTANIGVNLFMLITGYVCIPGRWKATRIVRLWLQVAFYTAAGILIACATGNGGIQLYEILPIPLACGYWYFTAYIGLFFLIPFLNEYLTSISKKRFQQLLIVAIIGCSFVCPHLPQRNLILGSSVSDFSVIWMVVMYISGAYVRLHLNKDTATKFYLFAYFGLTALQIGIFGVKNYMEARLGTDITLPILAFGSVSVFSYANSVLLFIWFTRLNVRSNALRKVLSWAAPMTFAFYLIHTNLHIVPLFRRLTDSFAAYTQVRCFHALVSALLIYVTCSLIDCGRILLFSGAERLFRLAAGLWKNRKCNNAG